jgi:hypothetical protein
MSLCYGINTKYKKEQKVIGYKYITRNKQLSKNKGIAYLKKKSTNVYR